MRTWIKRETRAFLGMGRNDHVGSHSPTPCPNRVWSLSICAFPTPGMVFEFGVVLVNSLLAPRQRQHREILSKVNFVLVPGALFELRSKSVGVNLLIVAVARPIMAHLIVL